MRILVSALPTKAFFTCSNRLSIVSTVAASRSATLARRPPIAVVASPCRFFQRRISDTIRSASAKHNMEAETAAATAPAARSLAEPDGSAVASTSGREVPSLDRDSFKQVLNVLALRVPNRKCAELMKAFRGFTLDRPRLRCIVADGGSSETKLLLLAEHVASLEALPSELQSHISREGLPSLPYSVTLDYCMLPAEAVLKRLLPPGVDAPSSFETIGHIAHLNLREEQLPYRHLIGAVLLDKNPHLKTIVNKVGSIENEFRVFQMEVVAGELRLETEVTQHGARFRLDFSQVYWNSRLECEHARLVGGMGRGQVLVDMMAGIGPFAIPAAQKGLTVYANDLNPRSAHYLALNARLNRLAGGATTAAPAPAPAPKASTTKSDPSSAPTAPTAATAPSAKPPCSSPAPSPPGPGPLHVFNMDARAFLRLLCGTPGGSEEGLRRQQQQEEEQAAASCGGCTTAAAAAAAAAAGGLDGLQVVEQQQQQQQQEVAANGQVAAAAATGTEEGQPSAAPASAPHSPTSHQPAKRQRTHKAAATTAASAAPADSSSPPPAVPPGFLPPAGGLFFDHVVMNLPASALEFLDAFSGALDPAAWRGRQLPRVHCYCFKRGVETEADIISKAERYLGGPLQPGAWALHPVRDVAPNKLMMCLSFSLPEQVAFRGRSGSGSSGSGGGDV